MQIAPLIIENFLTKTQCDSLIALSSKSAREHTGIQDTLVRDWKHVSDIVITVGTPLNDAIQQLHRKVGDKIVELYDGVETAIQRDVGYFYEYSSGDFYRPHVDSQTVSRINGDTIAMRKVTSSDVSSIVYLNDDYEGGEIEFTLPEIPVKLAAGSLLLFYGGWQNAHRVREITGGKRFCVVNWYATDNKLVPMMEVIPSPYAEYFSKLETEYQSLRS